MDEASDVGRITLDNKLTIGTRWGAAVAVAVAAQQQVNNQKKKEKKKKMILT